MADTMQNLIWWLPALLPPYLLVCSALRYRRRDELQRKFPNRAALARMTNVEAQEIVNTLAELEFPTVLYTSVQFALFKTYGIPGISQLLLDTKQFSSAKNVGKRYDDTGILIQEFTDHHPQSDRTVKALARLNYIHSRYQKAGRITNDQMIYTLSLFVTEPIDWVERYEWRAMTDTEKTALATLWKSIGDAMEISYHPLAHSTWTDGLQFYEDLVEWAKDYERSDMKPATSNKQVADTLIPVLLYWTPNFIRPFASQIVATVMGEQLRTAMMYPTPAFYFPLIVNAVFGFRSFVLRYLTLPRPSFMAVKALSDADPITGLYHQNNYKTVPLYVKPGFWNRWGLGAWFVYLMGGDVPGTKGNKYEPEGYKIEEVGPANMKGKGAEEMEAWTKKIRAERPTGCPFAFGIK